MKLKKKNLFLWVIFALLIDLIESGSKTLSETFNFQGVADRFARLPLYLTDLHGSQRVERVQEAMSHAVYVHDISHVIVDNMQFMLGTSMAGGGYSGLDRFTLQDSVVQIFRLVGSLAVLYCSVADPNSGSGAFLTSGSGMEIILILIRDEHPR
jgi:hypothetical protein